MSAAILTPDEVARHHIRIYRCPGYAVNGSYAPGCHPGHEPGGYDVVMGMVLINQVPMTLAEANEQASALRRWIAYIVKSDRDGPTARHSEMAPEHYTAEMFDVTEAPGTGEWATLRLLVAHTGRLTFARNNAHGPRFGIEGATGARSVPWDSLMYMERCGWVAREAGTDRRAGARVLTALGRRWGEQKKEKR